MQSTTLSPTLPILYMKKKISGLHPLLASQPHQTTGSKKTKTELHEEHPSLLFLATQTVFLLCSQKSILEMDDKEEMLQGQLVLLGGYKASHFLVPLKFLLDCHANVMRRNEEGLFEGCP